MKSITSLCLMFFIGQISSKIMKSTNNLLIVKFFGATVVTQCTTAYKLFSVFITLQGLMIMPMWSAYTTAKTRGDCLWIQRKLKKLAFLSIILCLGIVSFAVLIQTISDLWLGRELNYDNRIIWIMAFYFCIYIIASNYAALWYWDYKNIYNIIND